MLPPVLDDPGGVVTGPGWRCVIADRGWTRACSRPFVTWMPRRAAADAVTSEAEDEVVTSIDRYDEVDVFVGLDVGKGEHHAVALDREAKRLFDRALPNDERQLRAVIDQLASHGVVLLVVDQPATIGALPVAVAQAAGALVGYLPGLAMRRIADLPSR